MSVFSREFRVYYEDTDAVGVVYYANYLKWMERCRTDFLRSLGFNQTALAQNHAVVFAVHSLAIHYHKPAQLDDLIECDLSLTTLSPVKIGMVQNIHLKVSANNQGDEEKNKKGGQSAKLTKLTSAEVQLVSLASSHSTTQSNIQGVTQSTNLNQPNLKPKRMPNHIFKAFEKYHRPLHKNTQNI